MVDSAMLNDAITDKGNAYKKVNRSSHTNNDTNELTPREGSLCFSQAQQDSDETVEDLSELVFPEFCEALARVAVAKWESDAMPFKDKVALAIESMVHLERKLIRHKLNAMHKRDKKKKKGYKRPERRPPGQRQRRRRKADLVASSMVGLVGGDAEELRAPSPVRLPSLT